MSKLIIAALSAFAGIGIGFVARARYQRKNALMVADQLEHIEELGYQLRGVQYQYDDVLADYHEKCLEVSELRNRLGEQKAEQAKKFCIVCESTDSDCGCSPDEAGAQEYIHHMQVDRVPFFVRMGGLPDGIKEDDEGPFRMTWRRTWSAELGGSGNNQLLTFERV